MKKRGLFIALAAAGLVASVVAGREKPAAELLAPAARLDARVRAEALDLSALERRGGAEIGADLFATPRFAPAQKAAGRAAPAKPQAPALPFTYLGKVIEDGKLSVFLARGDESLTVAPGDTIGEYRVDAVTDREITFTYLPLKQKQKLPL